MMQEAKDSVSAFVDLILAAWERTSGRADDELAIDSVEAFLVEVESRLPDLRHRLLSLLLRRSSTSPPPPPLSPPVPEPPKAVLAGGGCLPGPEPSSDSFSLPAQRPPPIPSEDSGWGPPLSSSSPIKIPEFSAIPTPEAHTPQEEDSPLSQDEAPWEEGLSRFIQEEQAKEPKTAEEADRSEETAYFHGLGRGIDPRDPSDAPLSQKVQETPGQQMEQTPQHWTPPSSPQNQPFLQRRAKEERVCSGFGSSTPTPVFAFSSISETAATTRHSAPFARPATARGDGDHSLDEQWPTPPLFPTPPEAERERDWVALNRNVPRKTADAKSSERGEAAAEERRSGPQTLIVPAPDSSFGDAGQSSSNDEEKMEDGASRSSLPSLVSHKRSHCRPSAYAAAKVGQWREANPAWEAEDAPEAEKDFPAGGELSFRPGMQAQWVESLGENEKAAKERRPIILLTANSPLELDFVFAEKWSAITYVRKLLHELVRNETAEKIPISEELDAKGLAYPVTVTVASGLMARGRVVPGAQMKREGNPSRLIELVDEGGFVWRKRSELLPLPRFLLDNPPTQCIRASLAGVPGAHLTEEELGDFERQTRPGGGLEVELVTSRLGLPGRLLVRLFHEGSGEAMERPWQQWQRRGVRERNIRPVHLRFQRLPNWLLKQRGLLLPTSHRLLQNLPATSARTRRKGSAWHAPLNVSQTLSDDEAEPKHIALRPPPKH